MQDEHSNQANEFIAVNEIEFAVRQAKKAFEMTKDINEEPSDLQER